ncbi:MAG: hypothetical protein ACKPKO_23580, partial [Candidatus Fonsibacter sp.]
MQTDTTIGVALRLNTDSLHTAVWVAWTSLELGKPTAPPASINEQSVFAVDGRNTISLMCIASHATKACGHPNKQRVSNLGGLDSQAALLISQT